MAKNIHPYVRVLDDFDTHDAGTRLIIAGGVTSQLLLPGSGVGIGGQAYVAKFRPTSSNSASARLVEPPFDFHPSGNMTSQRIPSHWRHMKHALGENPDRVFGIVRMDNIWDIRKAYKTAQDWKKKQDDWCSAAQSSSRFFAKDLGEFPEAPLESEALVDVLNGKIKLNVHSYEVTDFDALIRLTNEFGYVISLLSRCSMINRAAASRSPESITRTKHGSSRNSSRKPTSTLPLSASSRLSRCTRRNLPETHSTLRRSSPMRASRSS